ncbi:MAG TPA: NlpC/P60 family protein, partial [Dermatophilaceae bacterium]
ASSGDNGCVSVVPAEQTSVAGLGREQLVNAHTIVAVGRDVEVPAYRWVIAVATAMQESGLRNSDHGDADSLGLFQQRVAWGSNSERTDAVASARMFYTGGKKAKTGSLQIQGWRSMTLSLAAQAVQHSAFPDAYAKWQPLALQIVGDPSVLSAVRAGGGGFAGEGSKGAGVFAAALTYLGTPYSWGSGGPNGPSRGFGNGVAKIDFDCSSLVQYAWQQGAALVLPRTADAQAGATARLPLGATLRAGDLLFFHDSADPAGSYHHGAGYAGHNCDASGLRRGRWPGRDD